jgi:hypothetical protein
LSDLYSVFEDRKIVKAAVEEEKKVVITTISLIDDDKRVTLLNLGVKKVTEMAKLSYAELRMMILSLDDSALGFDAFSNLKSIAPTKEELDKVKQFKGDPRDLDMPSRWVFEMKDVPSFEARIDFFIYKKDYESDFPSKME